MYCYESVCYVVCKQNIPVYNAIVPKMITSHFYFSPFIFPPKKVTAYTYALLYQHSTSLLFPTVLEQVQSPEQCKDAGNLRKGVLMASKFKC